MRLLAKAEGVLEEAEAGAEAEEVADHLPAVVAAVGGVVVGEVVV